MSTGTDRHANARDRKREKARLGKAMRGERSVFLIQEQLGKRAVKAKRPA